MAYYGYKEPFSQRHPIIWKLLCISIIGVLIYGVIRLIGALVGAVLDRDG